jgi:hypothetical protein
MDVPRAPAEGAVRGQTARPEERALAEVSGIP